jgi:hypothetical protein
MRDYDISMWTLFIQTLSATTDLGADDEDINFDPALDKVAEQFGEEVEWLVDVYLGRQDPSFTYSDGVTVNFKELGQ